MKGQHLTYETFVPELLKEIPEFRHVYNEHVAYHDELLSHVLMGDFTRFTCDAYRRFISGASDSARWQRIVEKSLEFLEEAIASPDTRVAELVSVSFIENLLPSEEEDRPTFEEIKLLLGPRLREELKLYEAH